MATTKNAINREYAIEERAVPKIVIPATTTRMSFLTIGTVSENQVEKAYQWQFGIDIAQRCNS
jgi:hypothetical protein